MEIPVLSKRGNKNPLAEGFGVKMQGEQQLCHLKTTVHPLVRPHRGEVVKASRGKWTFTHQHFSRKGSVILRWALQVFPAIRYSNDCTDHTEESPRGHIPCGTPGDGIILALHLLFCWDSVCALHQHSRNPPTAPTSRMAVSLLRVLSVLKLLSAQNNIPEQPWPELSVLGVSLRNDNPHRTPLPGKHHQSHPSLYRGRCRAQQHHSQVTGGTKQTK